MTVFKPGPEYRTRKGDAARVYATDGAEPHPVHGAIMTPDGWKVASWSTHGTYVFSPCVNDLIPPRPPVVVSDDVVMCALRSLYKQPPDLGTMGFERDREYAQAFITAYLDEQEAKP